MFSRNKQGERRVSPATYKVLLTTHIIVSVGWLGVVIAKIVLKLIALTTSAPDVTAALYYATDRISLAFPPLALSTIVTGVLLSLGTKWGLLDHYWVVTKLVLTVGVIVTAVQFGARIPRPAGGVTGTWTIDDSSLLGTMTSPASLLLAMSVTHLLMLAVATILSEYKPWGKTWFGRRKVAPAKAAPAIPATRGRAQLAHEAQGGDGK